MFEFLRKTPTVVGLDISSTAVKLLELSQDKGQYRVESYGVEVIPENAIVEKNIADIDAVGGAIKRVRQKSKTKVKEVGVAVAGSSIITKTLELAASLSEAQIEEQLLDDADKYIPYPLDEVAMDFQICRDDDPKGELVEVLLAACRRENIESREEALELGGFKPEVIDITFQSQRAGLRLCLTMCVLLASPSTWAAVLDSIDFATQSGDRFEIMLGFDGAPPEPVSYAIESPARISIDLIGVQSQLDKKYYRIGEGSARTVAVLEGEDRTRIVVSLPLMVPHEVTTLGRQMVVSVGRDLDRTRSQASASQNRAEELIAFGRGEQGEGRVVLRLPSEQTEVDIKQEAGNLLLTLVGVETSAAQQTQLDVTDFGTPINRIERARVAMGTELRVVMNQVFDYLAYQSGQELVIDVSAEVESPLQQEAIGEVVYEGEKISLNFQNIEVRAVLQIVADFANLNLVASDAVAGEITLRLKTVPWDQALDIVLKTKGLDKRLQGNVLIVAPAADLAAQELAELENKQQISDLAPLRTELIRVKYANASEIVGMIQGGGQAGQTGANNFGGNANRGQNGEEGAAGILSERGSVIVDDRTNSIILTETQDRINQLCRLLEQIDIPVKQVLIEARIVKASDSFKRESGIRWGSAGDITMGDDNASLLYGNNLETIGALRAGEVPADNLIVDLGTSSGRTGGIAFGTVDSDFLLDLELELYESEGTGETISRPTIITSDKSTASVNSGSQIPYQSDTGGGATATAFINATVGLTVTPQITPDDRIILQLNVTNNSRGDPTADGPPAIDTESIQTEVIVDDGETVVLGGLYQTRTDLIQLKTPVLGDLPVVGRLF